MGIVFQIDPRDPVPLYAQLERAIKSAVVIGKLKIGDQLPTVRQMAVDLKINANTVAKVYAELERQGILATHRGVGTFIEAAPALSALPHSKRVEELRALAERAITEATAHGFLPDELVEQIKRLSLSIKEKSHGRH